MQGALPCLPSPLLGLHDWSALSSNAHHRWLQLHILLVSRSCDSLPSFQTWTLHWLLMLHIKSSRTEASALAFRSMQHEMGKPVRLQQSMGCECRL